MRAALLLPLALLFSAPASAHEHLEAVWFQPIAPIVAGGAIIPLGFTHGTGPSTDFILELTPYWATGSPDGCLNGCRQRLLGLVATGGVSFGKSILSGAAGELDLFWAPKVIVAAANETGTPGYLGRDGAFTPGTTFEFGGGVDLGAEVHERRFGWFAALVLGLQYTKAFNYGLYEDWLPNVPGWPVLLVRASTREYRRNDWLPILVPNLNLLRVGFVF